MPDVIGLTGGAGSGKSTVAALLAECGAVIVDTDAIAHQLTKAGGPAMTAIAAAFGQELIDESGGLHRPRMRDLAFRDADARARLEAILHPLIHAATIEAVEGAGQAMGEEKGTGVIVLVVPLLFEKMTYRAMLRHVVSVDCSLQVQIERVARRPGVGLEQARAIVLSQIPRAVRLQLADEVIHNEADIEALAPAVRALHERLQTRKIVKISPMGQNSANFQAPS